MGDGPTRELTAASPEEQHQALLEVAEAIAQHRPTHRARPAHAISATYSTSWRSAFIGSFSSNI